MLVAGGGLRSAVLLLRKVGMPDCAQALAQAVADAQLDSKQGSADAGKYRLHGDTQHVVCRLLPCCCCPAGQWLDDNSKLDVILILLLGLLHHAVLQVQSIWQLWTCSNLHVMLKSGCFSQTGGLST